MSAEGDPMTPDPALKARRCDGCAHVAAWPNEPGIWCTRFAFHGDADHACNAWRAKP